MLDHDAKKDEENMDTMPEKIMKFGYDVGEPEAKIRDRIRARCWRTRNKKKKIESGHDGGEPDIKKRIEFRHDAGEPETKRRD